MLLKIGNTYINPQHIARASRSTRGRTVRLTLVAVRADWSTETAGTTDAIEVDFDGDEAAAVCRWLDAQSTDLLAELRREG
ncbi:MAG: hypothetical protein IPP13_18795 [Kouleothrix sp.]|jgi:hypothetical protein|nr:hypothetical protein [Kouleothrix sp.]